MPVPKEPVRQASIVSHLRDRIIRGTLPPGKRLPTRIKMAEQFDTTVLTVHRALTKLTDDGFVTASRARGTFVSNNPPHLCHYALVFPSHPIAQFPWGHMWQGLVNEAAIINRAGDHRRVTCYYDVDGHSDSEDYQKLVRDVKARRLAGVIFASGPGGLVGSPLLEDPDTPRIAISTRIASIPIQTIWPNLPGFLDRAVEYLAQRGRRAPAALIMSSPYSHGELARLPAAIENHGMRHKPYWFQFVDVRDREAPQRAAQAVMHRDQYDPPDSLIITDDTMLELATVGLAAAGLRVPEHIDIVAHSNFPWVGATAVPIKRLGFNLRGMMQYCIDSIDRQRRGRPVASHHDVPPQFDHELQDAAAAAGPPGMSLYS